jgi:RNA polymerase sigma-70 factor, ECF subfamily
MARTPSKVHSHGALSRIYLQMPPAAQVSDVTAPSDEDVLAEARAGSEHAFAALVRAHQAMVYGLAYRFFRSRGPAEDLAQDVFLALYQNLPRLETPAHVTFWLRRVTSNRCIDSVRRLRYRVELAMDPVPDQPVFPRPGDPLLGALLEQLVAELPPRARMVVTLRFQEDLDPTDIAAITDIPVNTVKSHLRRSMELLRKKLAARGHAHES